jgi:hypothetical protein
MAYDSLLATAKSKHTELRPLVRRSGLTYDPERGLENTYPSLIGS